MRGGNDAPDTFCAVVDGCMTCGDVAVPVEVLRVDRSEAVCRDGHGNEGIVAIDLLDAVAAGDRVLVHAGVAIARVDDPAEQAT